jgi:hypothetical protein
MNQCAPLPSLKLVREAQRSVAALLGKALGRAARLSLHDSRCQLERLALSDLCETLLARAEAVVRVSPGAAAVPPSKREEFVGLHLQGALLLWLSQASLTAEDQAAAWSVLAQLCPKGFPAPNFSERLHE